MSEFICVNNLTNFVKQKTCFKNSEKPSLQPTPHEVFKILKRDS